MASKSGMGYTQKDVPLMIERARALCLAVEFPSTENAIWLLEGRMGETKWITKNSGKEYFDGEWHNALAVHFDIRLPDGSNLADEQNRACFDAVQKWCFAYRSGWLKSDPSPKHWLEASRWALSFTSWVYLRGEEFFPQQNGFALLTKDDLKLLFEELSVDGWVTALKVIERSFSALYQLAYGCQPSVELMSDLPYVPAPVVLEIVSVLEANGLFAKHNPRDHRIISRNFLADSIGSTVLRFSNLSVRKFLRQFESSFAKNLTPSRASSPYQSRASSYAMDHLAAEPPTKLAMAGHATHCRAFFLSGLMPGIGIPNLKFDRDLIRELESKWGREEHRALIPLNESLSVLNEAACWITEYGDTLISLYDGYLQARFEIQKVSKGRSDCYRQARYHKAYNQLRASALQRQQELFGDSNMFSKLGLNFANNGACRQIKHGDLTLVQAVFSLIGACAYAIGMMKPLRDDELASIPFNCQLTNNKVKGCFAKFPVEKSEKQGLRRYVVRPIPYFTYLAMNLMQRLAQLTARIFNGGLPPSRLFYYPSGLGFDEPIKGKVSLSINRCMDIFCDYVNLPLDKDGARKYFRIHELRKFFLLMLSWDDPAHGLECGAWMAGHRDLEYIQAYTESTVSGAEVSRWAAEQVEVKLLQMEAGEVANGGDGLVKLYAELKMDLQVSSISGVPKAKFDSYVKNALEAGRYTVRLLALEELGGSRRFDFGVFIKENDSEKKF